MSGEVNIPLLRKAVEWAEAEAALPWGGRWYQRDYVRATSCGSAYCIAGWVLHIHGMSDEEIDHADPDVESADLLGIPHFDGTAKAGAHLFSDLNTIEDVRRIAEEIAGERL